MVSGHSGKSVYAFTLLFAALAGADTADRIGIYHWGGKRSDSMSAGVTRIASLGGAVARVAWSPKYYSDYGIDSKCYPNYSLTALATEPDVRRVLDHPSIRVLILTAYDGVTFGDCATHNYLNPEFYTPETVAALRAEYSDFVFFLFQRYSGAGRRFIISNWEGDNAIYCGNAFEYASNPVFRNRCDAEYPLHYAGNSGPAKSIQGMILWLRSRQEGIADGIERARLAGLHGVEVLHAPEISMVRTLEERGLRGVLHDVLPVVGAECVSYSSWESLNHIDPARALIADIAYIRQQSGTQCVIIGEAGYSRARWREQAVHRLASVVSAAMESGALYFVYWNLNDQGGSDEFGMFDAQDELTPCGALIVQTFQRRATGRTASRLPPGHRPK